MGFGEVYQLLQSLFTLKYVILLSQIGLRP